MITGIGSWLVKYNCRLRSLRNSKGYCHDDFAVVRSKLLKYLTKNPFSNIKLLLEHREENVKGFIWGRASYNQFLVTSLQYTGRI